MLQQILSEMYVDPELLAELDDEQKQILFCKMREEQVRRWLEHEKAFELERKNRKFVPSRKDQKSVQFLLGSNGEPWTWVMGEHKNDKNIDDILEAEARKKAMLMAEKETDELLLEKSDELEDKLAQVLVTEKNNNNITKIQEENKTNPIKTADNDSVKKNTVFQNIRLFEKGNIPAKPRSNSLPAKKQVPKALEEVSSSPVSTILSKSSNGVISSKSDITNTEPITHTPAKNVLATSELRSNQMKKPVTVAKPVPVDNASPKVADDSNNDFRSERNKVAAVGENINSNFLRNYEQKIKTFELKDSVDIQSTPKINLEDDKTPLRSTPSTVEKVVEKPVKYRAPQPSEAMRTPSYNSESASIKLDDSDVRRIITMEDSPFNSSEKPKLRRKPPVDKDSWLHQQKEKVKERLKEQRSSEIYQQITEGRKRISEIAEEINQEQEEIWKEQERKAKEAEKHIRDLARKARELHRRSSMMEEKPELKPKPTHTTSKSKDARLYTKVQIIDWFSREEVPKSVAVDPVSGEIVVWFHGLINREQAEHLLQDSPTGTFLVRLNDRIKGYVISYKTSDRCKHYLIDASNGNYQFFGANQIVHTTLNDLIQFHKTKPISSPGQEYLTLPCPQPKGAPNFANLFNV